MSYYARDFKGLGRFELQEEIEVVVSHMRSIAVFMPNPETHDNITQDMRSIFEAQQHTIDSLETEIRNLKVKIEKAIK